MARFLPSDKESAKYTDAYNDLGKKNNIILIFREKAAEGADEYAIEDAIDAFGEAFDRIDSTKLVPERQFKVDIDRGLGMIQDIERNYPLYLTDADYARMDSLLKVPGYVQAQLANDRQLLLLPAGNAVTGSIQSDPLHLFTPVLQRLRASSANENYTTADDYIFTKEGSGLAFMTSPYGTSESGMNTKVAALIDKAIAETQADHPEVQITAVGAPLISVSNATQIKKDTLFAIITSFLLIAILLILTYRRFSDIFWIMASIAFGWIVALGIMAVIRHSMSFIVLGVASVMIGIAVNYPLHYLDSLKTGISARQNLKEMVAPLLIGNITTIAAFLCLVWLDAVAMQDMGLFGSLMLAATIVFVLVFLPVFVKERGQNSKTIELGRILPDEAPKGRWVFLSVLAITVVLAIFSTRVRFDSNMQHINYMSDQQKTDLAMLESSLDREGQKQMYVIAEGGTLEEALVRNDQLHGKLSELSGRISMVKGAGNFVPSMKEQQRRIGKWNAFWGGGKAERLIEELEAAAEKNGFSEDAFKPFTDLLTEEYQPSEISMDSPVAATFEGTWIIPHDNGYRAVNQIYYQNPDDRGAIKSALEGDGILAFDSADVSNRLVEVLTDSFDYIGTVCSLVVFIFLLLSFQNIELSLLAFIPLVVSWFWILGIMGIAGLAFNVVNIILATFIFGQGDDYTIFMTEGLIYEYAYGRRRVATYKNSIFNSALIMFIGIGVLAFAKHPAMRSLGLVTVIGMFVVVVMAYYLPPVIFRWLTEKKGQKRDVPITIGRLLRSGWALLAFSLMMFLFIYPYTFLHFLGGSSEKRKESYHRFIHKFAKFISKNIPGVKFSMSNPHGTTFDKPALIIANHQSHLDSILLMVLHPKIVFATNRWAWNNPIYSYVLRKAEFYPIADGLEDSLEKIRDLAGRGYSIVVFPEGTRTLDGKIGRFHKGVFYVSQMLGLDIVPVCFHGGYHALPKNDFMLRRGAVHMEVGERHAPVADYREAAKEFRHGMINEYDELRRRLETPEYLSWYVRSKYLYKGADIEKMARQALRTVLWASSGSYPEPLKNAAQSELPVGGHDSDSVSAAVHIPNCGIGVYSLMFALMHQDTEVYATDPSEENIQIATNCSNLPKNLHYHIKPNSGQS